jgi:hypothetical protein
MGTRKPLTFTAPSQRREATPDLSGASVDAMRVGVVQSIAPYMHGRNVGIRVDNLAARDMGEQSVTFRVSGYSGQGIDTRALEAQASILTGLRAEASDVNGHLAVKIQRARRDRSCTPGRESTPRPSPQNGQSLWKSISQYISVDTAKNILGGISILAMLIIVVMSFMGGSKREQ